MPVAPNSSATVAFQFVPTDTLRYLSSLQLFGSDRNTLTFHVEGCGRAISSGVVGFTTLRSGDPSLDNWLRKLDPSDILLLPAHPNPASATSSDVTITCALRERAPASLKLYDLLGREQATLMSDLWHPGGVFDVHFDARHLTAGTYIYRL